MRAEELAACPNRPRTLVGHRYRGDGARDGRSKRSWTRLPSTATALSSSPSSRGKGHWESDLASILGPAPGHGVRAGEYRRRADHRGPCPSAYATPMCRGEGPLSTPSGPTVRVPSVRFYPLASLLRRAASVIVKRVGQAKSATICLTLIAEYSSQRSHTAVHEQQAAPRRINGHAVSTRASEYDQPSS